MKAKEITAEGWYWWRCPADAEPDIRQLLGSKPLVCLVIPGYLMIARSHDLVLEAIPGDFYGPLVPPPDLAGQPTPPLPSTATPTYCIWAQDSDGDWATSCGQLWCLMEGTPTQNDMTYCHGCGKEIAQSSYAEPLDDDEESEG